MRISCKEWKECKDIENCDAIGTESWYIVGRITDEYHKIDYCPFCGYSLNENGCTNSNIPYKEIIEYLNDKADRNFNYKTKLYRKKIRARWQEGMRLEDFKHVIDVKVKEWKGDDKMDQYLRPQTLFKEKMDTYRQEKLEEDKDHSRTEKFIKKMRG